MDLIPTSAPHWHLVLNHLPSVGTLVAVCLLAAARYTGSRELTRASLVLLVLLTLLTIPTFITGGAAQTALLERDGTSAPAMTAHLDAAIAASGMLLVTGWLAWFILWRDRRRAALDGLGPLAVLVLGAVSVLMMLGTARLGGDINHPEIRAGALPEGDGGGISAFIVDWVIANAWAWPTLEAVHFLGMALLFGAVLLVTTRVLGLVRQVPFAAFHRLLPLGVFGLGMNIVTGVAFFLVDTGRYAAMTYGFYPKMAAIVVGGVAVMYFSIFERPWELDANEDAPIGAKAMAMVTLLLWCAVIAYGRLLPYLPGA